MEFIEYAEELVRAISEFQGQQLKIMAISKLTSAEVNVIMTLGNNIKSQKKINMSEISKMLEISKPAVSQIISKIEKKGIVRRKRYAGDLKNVYVVFTASGQKCYDKYKELIIQISNELVANLGENDSKELIRIVKKIHEISKEVERKLG